MSSSITYKARVWERATVTGTGSVTLLNVAQFGPFQTFLSAVPPGSQVTYCIVDAIANVWELGVGVFTINPETLTRRVLESSTGALINFPGNVCDVTLDIASPITASAGTSNAGMIPALSSTGKLDFSFLKTALLGGTAAASSLPLLNAGGLIDLSFLDAVAIGGTPGAIGALPILNNAGQFDPSFFLLNQRGGIPTAASPIFFDKISMSGGFSLSYTQADGSWIVADPTGSVAWAVDGGGSPTFGGAYSQFGGTSFGPNFATLYPGATITPTNVTFGGIFSAAASSGSLAGATLRTSQQPSGFQTIFTDPTGSILWGVDQTGPVFPGTALTVGSTVSLSGAAATIGSVFSASPLGGKIGGISLTGIQKPSGFQTIFTDPTGSIAWAVDQNGPVFPGLQATIAGMVIQEYATLQAGTVLLVDPAGCVISSLGVNPSFGTGSSGSTTATSGFSTQEITAHNDMAYGRSIGQRDKFFTGIQPPAANYNLVIMAGQSEWEGIQALPALTLTQPYDSVMVGNSPRCGSASVYDDAYVPLGNNNFNPLISVNQFADGTKETCNTGGFSAVTGVVFSGNTITVTSSSTGVKQDYNGQGVALTSTAVGGSNPTALDFTQKFSQGLLIAFAGSGLTGAYAPLADSQVANQYTIASVTANQITLNQNLPSGVPATAVNGVSFYVTNNSAANMGEESGVSMVNFWRGMQLQHRNLLADPSRIMALANASVTGTSITQWVKSAAALYKRIVGTQSAVSCAMAAAKALSSSNTFAVTAVTWGQGGTDSQNGMSTATYQANLAGLAENLITDIVAQTGQKQPPLFMSFQLSGGNDGGVPIAQAQLNLMLNPPFPGYCLVGPGYAYPDNQFHYTPNGARNFGFKFGEVAHRIFDRGEGWLAMHPINITGRGTSILVDVHTPEPPLQVGVPYLNEDTVTYSDLGFTVNDVNGINPIVSATIVGDCEILIVVANQIAYPATLTYGDALHNGMGTVCDSGCIVSDTVFTYYDFSGQVPFENRAELVNKPYNPANWMLLFDLPIIAG